MRNHLLVALPLILWSGAGYCQDSPETALDDPTPAAVVDPSLAASHYFPPSLSTAGIATVMPRPAKGGHAAACNPANPCALATPARDRVVVAQP